ncbi:uncharacterized protein K444DRAFT_2880 [Hyaloscypha bicolor E]|uniref:Uncharacterized protein n=1 Tax=Hyaloscypha bicolor E TaxID=1095630 RepID=A0A2J6TVB7_9HELO|nr:uncharacterized protein K444DRAFT_2880 [Hyaloscypha bicolor E]PMD66960.1 hypothetical protein K444DRAFT_2880 [Hyaloscypha bicolor E]
MPLYYAGAGPNVCYTALSSAKQKSATAHCYRAFQRNPCKGGVTNIKACTCVQLLSSNRSTRRRPNQLDVGITAMGWLRDSALQQRQSHQSIGPNVQLLNTRSPCKNDSQYLFASPVVEDGLDHNATYSVSSVLKHLDLRLLFEVTERVIHWRGNQIHWSRS